MTRSVVSPTVIALDEGTLSQFAWQPVAELFPGRDPSELGEIGATPVVHVGLAGRYQQCPDGRCKSAPGTEDFLFSQEHSDLMIERHPS
jgi:hypothetical protein